MCVYKVRHTMLSFESSHFEIEREREETRKQVEAWSIPLDFGQSPISLKRKRKDGQVTDKEETNEEESNEGRIAR